MKITGLGVLTAAGAGVKPLRRLLSSGADAFRESAPYADTGLRQARCAWVEGLSRERPAEAMLAAAAEAALGGRSGAGVGFIVATSSGNISGPWQRWHQSLLAGTPASGVNIGRDGPTRAVAEALGLTGPQATISVACASGTAALCVGLGWIEDGLASAVLVAGVDALSLFVHAGFDGLGALSASTPRPFSAERDGLLLGEGAAALLLEPEDAPSPPLAALLGAGLACDAVHMTAPCREGRGAAAAMAAALDDAGVEPAEVDLIAAHGTGTRFNDAMEQQAFHSLFPEPIPVHGIKQAIGHTLGATGLIEAAVAVDAIATGWCPPVLVGPQPPHAPEVVLSTNSAFGGMNAAAVLSAPRRRSPRRPPRRAIKRATVALTLPPGPLPRCAAADVPPRFLRMTRYDRVGFLGILELMRKLETPLPPGTGIVLGTATGCSAVDRRYHARLLERGAGQVSRLDFSRTIPGSPAAEAAIVLKLTGPTLTLIGSSQAVDDESARLIRHHRAETLLSIWLEAPGSEYASEAILSFWDFDV